MSPTLTRVIVVVAFATGVALGAPRPAEAGCPAYKEVEYRGKMQKQPAVGKVERTLGGKLFTSTRGFPYGGGTAQQYISKVRAQNVKKFWEDKATKTWKVYFAAYFRQPLDSLEVQIRLYDVTPGQAGRQIASFAQDLDPPPCTTSFISDIKLDREAFGVNKRIMMAIDSNSGKRLASGIFEILGEAEKYTGKAVFTDDDTQEPGAPKEPPKEKEPDPVPEKDPEIDKPIDYNDPKYNSRNLNPEQEDGFQDANKPRSNRGCGCRADTGSAGGGLLLALAALIALRPRRRRAGS